MTALASLRSILLALLALASWTTSCVSLERLGRHSPFSGDSSAERVSLWPLVHAEQDSLAVAWPLFDVDSRGFALRPLVAADSGDWEVLFPWASHDAQSGRGWAAPAYWSKRAVGFFPLFHLGQFSYVGPVYWRREAGRTRWGGVFPLALLGEFNHVGPVWWESRSPNWGVFPLFGVGATRHVGPAWWSDEGWGLFPLVWSSADSARLGLLPFYAHRRTPSRTTRVLLAGLLGADRRPGRDVRWAAPLYYSDERADRSDELLLPLYYERRRGSETQVFTLLGNRSVRDDGGSLNVYPLWWSSRSGDAKTRMLLPLFYYEQDGDERALLTPLGGRGWSSSGATRYLNVLGPLYHHSASADGRRERTALAWPLYERVRTDSERTLRSVPFFSSTSDSERSEGWYALGLGHFERTKEQRAHRFWPFFSSSEGVRAPGWLYDWTLFGRRGREGRRESWLFPLYASKSEPALEQTQWLLGAASHATSGGQTSWRAWPFASSSNFDTDNDWLHWATLVGRRRRAGTEQTHVLTPLVYLSDESSSPHESTRSTHVLALSRWRHERRHGLVLPDSSGLSQRSRSESSELSLLFSLFTHRLERFVVWREDGPTREEAGVLQNFDTRLDSIPGVVRDESAARAILERRGHAPLDGSPQALRDALAHLLDSSTTTVERRSLGAPLLFHYERGPDSLEWSGPLSLVRSRRDAHSAEFSFLYYGYRSVTKGDTTRRDIFPFITWDSGPGQREVSFFWRLLRYRRDGERTGGHVLFIPWGDA